MRLLLLPLAFLLHCFAPTPPRIELKGYSSYQSHLIETTGDALAIYARTREEYQNGTVILAFKKRLSKRTERALFEITDTVHVRTANPGRCITIATCLTDEGDPRLYFVLFRADAASTQYLRNRSRVWGVNAQHQLVEVPLKNLKCRNPDYGL